MGIDKYNAECRKIVMRYANEWEVCIHCSVFSMGHFYARELA